jgi:AraC family L-rhamnose operon transcriptional activator RhaR
MSNQRRPRALLWQHLYGADAVPIVAQRVPSMNGDFEPHSHDFVEVVLVLSGQGKHVSLNGERLLAPNDVITLRPGAWHIYHSCQQLVVYNCCFSYELFQRELAWTNEEIWFQQLFKVGTTSAERHSIHFFHLTPSASSTWVSHLDMIHSLKQTESLFQKTAILGHLLLLLSQFALCISEADEPGIEQKQAHPRIVFSAKGLLDEQCAYPWSLDALSNHLGIDRSYLVRLFTAHIGVSPMAYLARRRAEQAAHLLISTDLPIAAIGVKVGWPEPRHFARRFKAHTGVSASEYRARFFAPLIQPDQTHQNSTDEDKPLL